MADTFHDARLTERRNPRSERLDTLSPAEIVDLINAEDAGIAGGGVANLLKIRLILPRLVSAVGARANPHEFDVIHVSRSVDPLISPW